MYHLKRATIKGQIIFTLIFILTLEVIARCRYWWLNDIPFLAASTETIDEIYDHHHPYLPVVFRKSSYLKTEPDIQTNNVGFRGPNILMPKPRNHIRLVALGGSATWGQDVKDEQAWPRIIQTELRLKFPQFPIEVVNAGVPGYNSMEDLINLITRVLPLEPDIVMVYQAYNDMKSITRATTFEPDYSDWRSRENPHDNIQEKVARYSRLVFGLSQLAKKVSGEPVNNSKKKFEDHGQLKSFKRNIINIVAICQAHNIVPVLSTFNLGLDTPYIYRKYYIDLMPSEFRVMLNAYNRQIREVASQYHVLLVDAEGVLPDDTVIHTDLVHFTVEGNQRLARVFVDSLVPVVQEIGRMQPARNSELSSK
jgi:lysophospholipase L1-like esterase